MKLLKLLLLGVIMVRFFVSAEMIIMSKGEPSVFIRKQGVDVIMNVKPDTVTLQDIHAFIRKNVQINRETERVGEIDIDCIAVLTRP